MHLPEIYERIYGCFHTYGHIGTFVCKHIYPCTNQAPSSSPSPLRIRAILPVSTPFQLSRMRVCNASCIRHTCCVDVDCRWDADSAAGCSARLLLGIRLLFLLHAFFVPSSNREKERAPGQDRKREELTHRYTHTQRRLLLLLFCCTRVGALIHIAVYECVCVGVCLSLTWFLFPFSVDVVVVLLPSF